MHIRSFAFTGRWMIILGQLFMGLSAWICIYNLITLEQGPLEAWIYLGLLVLRGIMIGGKWAVRPPSTTLFQKDAFSRRHSKTIDGGNVSTTNVKLVGDEFIQQFGSPDLSARTVLKEIKLNEALATGVSKVRG